MKKNTKSLWENRNNEKEQEFQKQKRKRKGWKVYLKQ